MIKIYKAWVIDTRSEEGHGLIGEYGWFYEKSPNVPPELEGCPYALFRTREIARKYLLSVKRGFPKAKVKKAKIAISWSND